MKKLIINCNQNDEIGFGHFFRCLYLAKHLKTTNLYSITFIGEYSKFSKNILTSEKIKFNDTDSSIENFLENYEMLIIDRYDLNKILLKKISSFKNLIKIAIDDFNNFSFKGFDLVINFRHKIENIYSYKAKNKAIGLNYFINNPELNFLRKNYFQNKKIKNILLFSSGSNMASINFNKIINEILSNRPNINLHHVSNTPFISNQTKYFHYNYSKNIIKLIKKSDLIINGGGMMKYESIYCGIPSATLSITKEQHIDTLILSKENLIWNLGIQTDQFKKIKEKLNYFLNSDTLRSYTNLKCVQSIPINSAQNIIKIINEL